MQVAVDQSLRTAYAHALLESKDDTVLDEAIQQLLEANQAEKLEVKGYFETTGFDRWNRIYSDSDDVNRVQRNIRSGHNVLGADTMPEIDSTKFERAIALRVMNVWDSSNLPMRQAARQISMAIEAELINRYHNTGTGMKPISIDVIADVTEKVNEELAAGGDVREAVLETMSARAGGVLQGPQQSSDGQHDGQRQRQHQGRGQQKQ